MHWRILIGNKFYTFEYKDFEMFWVIQVALSAMSKILRIAWFYPWIIKFFEGPAQCVHTISVTKLCMWHKFKITLCIAASLSIRLPLDPNTKWTPRTQCLWIFVSRSWLHILAAFSIYPQNCSTAMRKHTGGYNQACKNWYLHMKKSWFWQIQTTIAVCI